MNFAMQYEYYSCYAPTNDSPEELNDEYYEELQNVIDEIPKRDMKIVIGDFNAKVGRNNQGIENVMGVEGLGEVANENGALLYGFLLKTQTDHIAVNKERMSTQEKCKVHILVLITSSLPH
ncbi:craniofacial development protein 2-like [Palaemon carinicauda]|uniref:craniofacial development protein 2-like n=1 Tax=Palaemon carinicauda TaxID=392227 RepID=UPI0035B584D6